MTLSKSLLISVRQKSEVFVKYIEQHIARANGENRIASADCGKIKIVLRCGKHQSGNHFIVRAEYNFKVGKGS